MGALEIIFAVILAVICAGIIVLTATQTTKGQGLNGAINGNYGMMGSGRISPADAMMAKITRIAGVVLVVVCIVASAIAGRVK